MIEHAYIHIPFCVKKCAYCSFQSHTCGYDRQALSHYLSHLRDEIDLFKKRWPFKLQTLYFGGGTASLLTAAEIIGFIEMFDYQDAPEITLEINPREHTESPADLHGRINRISIGAQSFYDHELAYLGRSHTVDDVVRTYREFRAAGFDNISLDIVYGLPRQMKGEVDHSINEAIRLGPEHISIYCLSLEKDSPLYPDRDHLPSDEILAGFYHSIRATLAKAGFRHYEISNFAKPGFESRHNNAYWLCQQYAGFGAAAAGYLNNTRYINPFNLNEYYMKIRQGEYYANEIGVSSDDHEKEFIFLGLRLMEGIDLKRFRTEFGYDFVDKYQETLDKWSKLGFLEVEGNRIRLTPEAYFVSNSIMADFV